MHWMIYHNVIKCTDTIETIEIRNILSVSSEIFIFNAVVEMQA